MNGLQTAAKAAGKALDWGLQYGTRTATTLSNGSGLKDGAQFAKDTAAKATSSAYTFAAQNPGAAACYAVAGVAVGVAVVPAVVTAPALAAAGFGSGGPVVGTLATAWQSSIGIVGSPSMFATLQSAAMGGYGATTVASGVSAVFGTGGAAAAATGEYFRRRFNL